MTALSEADRREAILMRRALLNGVMLYPHNDSLEPDCTELWWALPGGRVLRTSHLHSIARDHQIPFRVLA